VVSRRGPSPAARRIAIDAHAKLNLTLAVGPARADGFHDLVTVFQSVSLADTLIVEPRTRGFTLVVRHEDASLLGGGPEVAIHGTAGDRSIVPAGADNLVLRAAHRVARELDLGAGARFTLVKRIPAGAGLGGGSADAAAVIAALPVLYGLRLPRARALAIALELGSDVPFAFVGGTALGVGRGENLTRVAIDGPFEALVAVPAWRISTGSAFARIDRIKYGLTLRGVKLRSAQILGRERLSAASLVRLGNTFEKVLGNRRSDFLSLGMRLRHAGAVAVRMSGSGSSVFGVLGPGSSIHEVAARFTGSETLYAVRSARTGLRRHT
jgi:4-diphosphocytidyl-2-C-methyl-D-erythritol kinase